MLSRRQAAERAFEARCSEGGVARSQDGGSARSCRGGQSRPGVVGLASVPEVGSGHRSGVEGRGGAGPVGEGRPWARGSVRWAHGRERRWPSPSAF